MKHLSILCVATILISSKPFYSKAQNEILPKSSNQKHLLISTSLGFITYRDFATSPLFYKGRGSNIYMGWQNINENGEFNLGLDFLANLTFANAPESDLYEVSTMGVFTGLEGNVSYLRKLKPINIELYDFKLGGTLVGNQNMRFNSSFDNSSTGIESIVNMMVSAKAERDISRREASVINFAFMSFQIKPVRRTLAFQMDAGVLNFNRRPSYNYAYNAPIDGTNTSQFSYVWDYYSWSMNGWRLRSKLEFTQYNSGGNGHRIEYGWDAMHVPGKHAAYQMGMHRLGYTLLFNNNR